MAEIRFDGQVAIVTGAGGGLGRAHALELARRGAKVLVNDLGAALDGSGGGSAAAQAVVAEIQALGGEAVADGASVTDDLGVERMARLALDRFGRIDILIANAGILRDKSFGKMELGDFQAVLDVHLIGAVKTARAVWNTMHEQRYGRIVFTTSSSGLYGNFGQANYAAAKTGLLGLMQTLRLEGDRDDIRVNAICPVAATRMTEGLLTPEMRAELAPEKVTPGVIHLCSAEAPNGAILTAGAGTFALARIVETAGAYLGPEPTAEAVADAWSRITDPASERPYAAGGEQMRKFLSHGQTN